VIVELKALSDFASGVPNNSVGVGVVRRRSIEDLDAQRPFLQEIRLALKGVLHDILQQSRVALAAGELGTSQYLLQFA
jgi:hypothetical protein